MNIFNPIAYVKKIKYEQTEIDKKIIAKKQEQEFFDAKNFALTRCPNVKHGNRIYVYKDEKDQVIAASVSPINENFRSQIEDGVWEIVNSLIKKNYFTTSSCEGHFNQGPLQFIVAIPNLEFAEKIRDLFSSIKFVTAEVKESTCNIEVDITNIKNPKYKRVDKEIVNYEKEATDINYMYFRTYKRYWFLRVHIYKKGTFWNLFLIAFKLFFENKCKKNIIDLINSEKFPISPY